MSKLVVAIALTVLTLGAPALRAETEGDIEFGYQFVDDDFGSEKFDQYRDERPGLIGNGRLYYSPDGYDGLYFDGEFENAANSNQFYGLTVGRWGRFSVNLRMSQLPVVFSNQAFSAYGGNSNANLILPAAFVRTPAGLPASVAALSTGERLELRERDWGGEVLFRASEALSLRGGYELLDKQGSRPNSLLFGFFTNFVEIPQPIDEQTHRTRAGLSWTGADWTFDLDYDGSMFRNDYQSTVVDNPIQGVDVVGTSSRAQPAAAPDNTSHRIGASWSSSLKQAGFPAAVSASLSYARRTQDESFLPATINSALASPALPQEDLDGDVRTIVGHARVTARPRPGTTVKAAYRVHQYTTETDRVVLAGRVAQDATVALGALRAPTYDFRRQNGSLDFRTRVGERSTLGGGYEWENWRRDSFREVSHLNEHTGKLRFDTRVGDRTRVRLGYQLGLRNGNDYSVVDPTNLAGLETYDQADRRRQKLDLLATTSLGDRTELTLTGGWIDDNYDDNGFGLKDEWGWNAGASVAVSVIENVEVSAFYQFERDYQRHRAQQSGGTGGNWEGRLDDRSHTIGVETGLELIPDKLRASIGWDYHAGKSQSRASGAPAGGPSFDFPSVKNNLQVVRASFDYAVNEQWTFKTAYRFERYDANDFKVDGLALNQTGTDVYLGDLADDYRANVFVTSLVYSFD